MNKRTPPLDDGDFERLLGFRDGLRRFLRWSEEQAQATGLTPTQHQLLLAVRGHRGDPSVGDVAGHLMLRHHSAVELIDRASAAGLVERFADTDDHRVVRVRLTPDGSDRLARLSALHLAELTRLSAVIAAMGWTAPDDQAPAVDATT